MQLIIKILFLIWIGVISFGVGEYMYNNINLLEMGESGLMYPVGFFFHLIFSIAIILATLREVVKDLNSVPNNK